MKRLHPIWHVVGWLLAVVALVSMTASAPAQSRPAPASRGSFDAAKKHMERGQELFAQEKFAEAAEAFAAAYQTEPYAAFLYNEAVCHQKLKRHGRALDLFRKYLSADPSAPDADQTRARIVRLEAALAAESVAEDAGPPADAGLEAGSADAAVEGGVPPSPRVVDEPAQMKSLVLIESEPPGAPVAVYFRASPTASSFEAGTANPGWNRVASGTTPLSTTLDVGRYHIVLEPFADFHRSETDMDVAAGHVHQFKANLRQGEFLAFLRVTSPQLGARIYLDDPPPHQRPPWGVTPHEGLVGLGDHQLWIEKAGFEPASRKFSVTHGEQREEVVELSRIARGTLRFEGNAASIAVEIDGRPVGLFRTGEPVEVELSAGPHDLTAHAEGRKDLAVTIAVPRGRVQPVDLVMMPKTPRGGAWTQAAVSAAFLGGGTFLGLRANSVYDELEQDRKAGILTENDDRYTRGKIYAIGADACFGVGGILAVVSAYNFIKDPTPPSGVRLGVAVDYADGAPGAAAEPPRARPGAARSFPHAAPPNARPEVRANDEGASLRVLPWGERSGAALLFEGRF